MSIDMSSPKDITEALASWHQKKGEPRPVEAQPSPGLRRMRADAFSGTVYCVLGGLLVSQLLFLLMFNLF